MGLVLFLRLALGTTTAPVPGPSLSVIIGRVAAFSSGCFPFFSPWQGLTLPSRLVHRLKAGDGETGKSERAISHGFAVDGAGYAGGLEGISSPFSDEGLRGRMPTQICRSLSPADGATCAHAFAVVLASGLLLQSPRSHGVQCLPLRLFSHLRRSGRSVRGSCLKLPEGLVALVSKPRRRCTRFWQFRDAVDTVPSCPEPSSSL
jgi:hypothetical protein